MKFRYISFQLELIVSSIGDSCDILHFMVHLGRDSYNLYENEHCGVMGPLHNFFVGFSP